VQLRARGLLAPADAVGGVKLLVLAAALAGCARGAGPGEEVGLRYELDPLPPRLGRQTVTLRLVDGGQRPIAGARVSVEGNMNHAGMVPSIATVQEKAPGLYLASLEITMRGQWFLLVEARLASGARIERKIDLPLVAER
jgi:hypothetical protein